MPVTKTIRECYEVRNGWPGGEWANITLKCWDNPPQPGYSRTSMYYCGEITIQSSFGTWGYIWTACAVPFKQFLLGAEFDYVFTKFMGHKLDRFDGEASVREVRKWITTDRRTGSMSKAEAREAWEAVDDVESQMECSEHDYGTAMIAAAPAPVVPLTDERLQKHAMRAGDCPPGSMVVLLSSLRRMLSAAPVVPATFVVPGFAQWRDGSAAPVVRGPLTREQIAKALASAGLKPEDYRKDGLIEPLVWAIEQAHGIGGGGK